ncbi:MAG: hypothetical protein HC837_16100 [Chloroflexaceae bacterium]|nr:hypothetical protein [Chloroflexaceae bacterium]
MQNANSGASLSAQDQPALAQIKPWLLAWEQRLQTATERDPTGWPQLEAVIAPMQQRLDQLLAISQETQQGVKRLEQGLQENLRLMLAVLRRYGVDPDDVSPDTSALDQWLERIVSDSGSRDPSIIQADSTLQLLNDGESFVEEQYALHAIVQLIAYGVARWQPVPRLPEVQIKGHLSAEILWPLITARTDLPPNWPQVLESLASAELCALVQEYREHMWKFRFFRRDDAQRHEALFVSLMTRIAVDDGAKRLYAAGLYRLCSYLRDPNGGLPALVLYDDPPPDLPSRPGPPARAALTLLLAAAPGRLLDLK